jgi:serine/threonine protein phosphatase PrpC
VHSERSGLQPKVSEPVTQRVDDPGIRADVFGLTDRGRVRTSNQDHFLIASLERSLVIEHSSIATRRGRRASSPQGRLLGVADGMGGYVGGGLASSVAIDALAAFVLEVVPWFVASNPRLRAELTETLEVGVRGSDEAVFRTASELDLDERMGTTLTAAYVVWPEAYLVHVGDSRAHRLRDGTLERLTRDHTMAEQLLAVRAIDARQAARSKLRHVLVNTVGGQREKVLTVDVSVIDLCIGDTLLLCSDGVAAHLGDQEVGSIVGAEPDAETAARAVIDAVQARGAADNVTVVVARF